MTITEALKKARSDIQWWLRYSEVSGRVRGGRICKVCGCLVKKGDVYPLFGQSLCKDCYNDWEEQ